MKPTNVSLRLSRYLERSLSYRISLLAIQDSGRTLHLVHAELVIEQLPRFRHISSSLRLRCVTCRQEFYELISSLHTISISSIRKMWRKQ